MPYARSRGRRPKSEGDTRAKILDAALRRFSTAGFDQTTSVAVAREAHVDPALILYYFDSKETLFLEAVAQRLYPQLETAFAVSAPSSRLGESVARAFLSLWDAEGQGRALAALVRAGVSNERIGRLLRDYIQSEILPQVAQRVGKDSRDLRVSLVASQLFGLGLARYVLHLEPVASAPREELVAAVGPTITRYLTARLDKGAPAPEL